MLLEVCPACVNLVAGFNDPLRCRILYREREWVCGRTDKSTSGYLQLRAHNTEAGDTTK